MKEGEPVLGGPQVSPGNVQPTNPGVQPAGFETLQNTQNTQAAPLTPPPSPTFTPNVLLGEARLNNPNPQPAPVSPPTSTQSQFFAQPTAPNMGDVVLSDTPPQKPKKGLITAIIICLILLITAGITAYFITRSNNNAIIGDNADTAILLNRYSNYLLYGENSDSVINDASAWSKDEIEKNLASDENTKAAYFNNLIDLHNKFSSQIYEVTNLAELESESDETELLIGLLNNGSSALEALKLYAITPNLTMEEMVSSYFARGGSGMVTYIEETYADFINSDNQKIYSYGASKIGLANAVSNLYNEYANLGCISDQAQTLIEGCTETNDENEAITNNLKLIEDYLADLDDTEWHMTNDVVASSRMTYKTFYNIKDKNEE